MSRRRALLSKPSGGAKPTLVSFKNEVVWYSTVTAYDRIELFTGNTIRVRSHRGQVFVVPLDFTPIPNHKYLLNITLINASDARYEAETYIRMIDSNGALTTPYSNDSTGRTPYPGLQIVEFTARADSAIFYIGYNTTVANIITIGDVYLTDLGEV